MPPSVLVLLKNINLNCRVSLGVESIKLYWREVFGKREKRHQKVENPFFAWTIKEKTTAKGRGLTDRFMLIKLKSKRDFRNERGY